MTKDVEAVGINCIYERLRCSYARARTRMARIIYIFVIYIIFKIYKQIGYRYNAYIITLK